MRQVLFVLRNARVASWIWRNGRLLLRNLNGNKWNEFTPSYWEEWRCANQVMEHLDAMLLTDVPNAFGPLPDWLAHSDEASAWTLEKLSKFVADEDFQLENILLVQGGSKKVLGDPEKFHFNKYHLYSSCVFDLQPRGIKDALRQGSDLSGCYEESDEDLTIDAIFRLQPHCHVTIRNGHVTFAPQGAFVLSEGAYLTLENCVIELQSCSKVPSNAISAIQGGGCVLITHCMTTGKGVKRFASVDGSQSQLEIINSKFEDIVVEGVAGGDHANADNDDDETLAAPYISSMWGYFLMDHVDFIKCVYNGNLCFIVYTEPFDCVSRGCQIRNCRFSNCDCHFVYNGTKMTTDLLSAAGSLIDCSFSHNDGGNVEWSAFHCERSLVQRCIFSDGSIGIFCGAGADGERVLIESCQFVRCHGAQIKGAGIVRGLEFTECDGAEWLVDDGIVSEADIRVHNCQVEHVIDTLHVTTKLVDMKLNGEHRDWVAEEAKLIDELYRRMCVVQI